MTGSAGSPPGAGARPGGAESPRGAVPPGADAPRASGSGAVLDAVDRRIAGFMRHWGTLALRVSLAVIFVWFGVLKPLGLSPAESMVRMTVQWLPLLSPGTWVVVIGWWEVAIGLTFLFRSTVRVAIALLALQMAGTFMPLVLLPDVVYQPGHVPYGLTIEGQYVVKNLLIISAALVLGGTVRQRRARRPG